ncbi:hypothetical protein LI328DRAFT_14905 [Trichoderma asperelloides]|nr:hypothetical protein LI328DRAFT_14905 [Trichoderma asperelloides]
MQPTAVGEALIGEAPRLSNARESWLDAHHSDIHFYPYAKRPKGGRRHHRAARLGKNTRGEAPMPRDSKRLEERYTLLASRHVAQSKKKKKKHSAGLG